MPIPSGRACRPFAVIRFLTSVLVSLLVIVGLAPLGADAHSGKQSYLYVSVFEDGVEGRIEMPAADLAAALGNEIPASVPAARAAVAELTAPITEYVEQNFALAGASGSWTIDFADKLTVLPTENGPYVVLDYVVREEFDGAPTSFVADFSIIIENDENKDALLIIEDDWASATFNNGEEPLLGFSVGQTEQQVNLGGASTVDSIVAIRGLGTDAVRNGIDLMLIVAAVALPAVLIPATRRTHVISRPDLGRRIGSAFVPLIAGHSITLWLVGLGVITPSTRLIGILVAAGLAIMAVFGLVASWRPTTWSLAPTIIAIVGLLQGLGLGDLFLADGLDRRRPLTSLLAFHIGVEVALVIIAAIVIVPLGLLRRTRLAPAIGIVLGGALAGYGVAWFLERLTESDWPIEEVANPFRVWPRNLIFVAIAIAIAYGLRRWDARAGRLRPIEQSESPADSTLQPPTQESVSS